MASDIKHSLIVGMGSEPHLIALELAAIKTMYERKYDANRVTGAHYILESETPLLIATPELEAAIEALLEAAEFTMSIGVLATTDGQYGDGETISTVRHAHETLRNALAGLKGNDT